jgi:hypothetical protein
MKACLEMRGIRDIQSRRLIAKKPTREKSKEGSGILVRKWLRLLTFTRRPQSSDALDLIVRMSPIPSVITNFVVGLEKL